MKRYKPSMVKKLLALKKMPAVDAPKGEREFMAWLNTNQRRTNMPKRKPNPYWHPKFLHGFAGELPKTDKRHKLFTKQRKERGFDSTELWSLDITIAKFIVPRIKAFRKHPGGYPGDLTPEKWDQILEKIQLAFETIIEADCMASEEQSKIIEDGLDLFRKFFLHLWN